MIRITSSFVKITFPILTFQQSFTKMPNIFLRTRMSVTFLTATLSRLINATPTSKIYLWGAEFLKGWYRALSLVVVPIVSSARTSTTPLGVWALVAVPRSKTLFLHLYTCYVGERFREHRGGVRHARPNKEVAAHLNLPGHSQNDIGVTWPPASFWSPELFWNFMRCICYFFLAWESRL